MYQRGIFGQLCTLRHLKWRQEMTGWVTLLTNEDDIQKIDEARREGKRGRTRDQVVMAHADTQLAYIG